MAIDTEILEAELQSIYDKEGELTPSAVVTAAKPKNHPLHSQFTWDDKDAADQFRLEQARGLIRSVKIVFKRADGEYDDVRSWHSVRRPSGTSYEPADKVAKDPFLREMALREMQRDWMSFKSKYESFAEFVSLMNSDGWTKQSA